MSYAPLLWQRVLFAVETGAETSREVADDLGIPVANASAILGQLVHKGLIRRNGRFWRFDGRSGPGCEHGRLYHRYAPCEATP